MITVREQVRAVEKIISARKSKYPRMIEVGKMTKAEAEHEIRIMESIRESLLLMPGDAALLKV